MIFLLVGPVHSGKTTFLKSAVLDLDEHGVRPDGFLSIAVREGRETAGYDLFDLKTGKSFPFLRRTGEEHWLRTGPFRMNPETLAEAEKILLRGRGAGLLVVDEVGPLELEGRGLWPALDRILRSHPVPCLLVVRERIVKDLVGKLKPRALMLFHREELTAPGPMAEAIVQALSEG